MSILRRTGTITLTTLTLIGLFIGFLLLVIYIWPELGLYLQGVGTK